MARPEPAPARDSPVDEGGEAAPASAPCAPEHRRWVLAATIAGSAMAFVDGTVVNIALPAIQRSFDASVAGLQWVVNGYLLLLGALILVGGALGDRVGRKRVFLAGIVLFALASLGCALAPTLSALVVARVAQGIGAAMLVPQSLAILAACFPSSVRGKAIGSWAAASAITTSIGPPLGGLLIDLLSWRVAFWINLPLAAAALWLTWRYVPENRDERARGALDWAGAAIAVAALAALTFGLSELSAEHRRPAVCAVALAIGLVGLVALALVERRAAHPLIAPELFRSRVFFGANVVTVLLYGSMAAALFLLPFDLVARRGLSASRAGLTILPLGVIIGALSRPVGELADRLGPRRFLVAGPLLVAIAQVGLAWGQGSFWLGVVLPMVVLAGGMALVVSPLTTAVMNAAPEGKSGAASGVNNAASRLAGALAVGIIGAIAATVFARHAPPGARFGMMADRGATAHAAASDAFVAAYRMSLLCSAVWSALAAVTALLSLPRKTG
jgi:EmrB/QacA subfamily drug resistance transporter